MVKKIILKKGWLLIILFIYLMFIYASYLKLKTAQNNLAEYRLAVSCLSKDNCREKYEATIVESHAVITHIIRISRTGNGTPPSTTSVYVLTINSSALGNRTIEISPNPPSVGTPFDIGNVQIPPDRGTKFVQENFFAGETVYIETWRDQIIFLYVNEIVELPKVNYEVTPLLIMPEQQTFLNPSPPKTYAIAMPTSIHPILLHAVAQYNFSWTAFFGVVIFLVIFKYMFNGK